MAFGYFLPSSISSVVDCGNLTNPEQGLVSISETTFQSEANYSCLEGHELDGNATRICLESGSWSEPEPMCNRKYIAACCYQYRGQYRSQMLS